MLMQKLHLYSVFHKEIASFNINLEELILYTLHIIDSKLFPSIEYSILYLNTSTHPLFPSYVYCFSDEQQLCCVQVDVNGVPILHFTLFFLNQIQVRFLHKCI